jgi:hypothetical protein
MAGKLAAAAFGIAAAVGGSALGHHMLTKEYQRIVEGTFQGECDLRQRMVTFSILPLPSTMETSIIGLTVFDEVDMKHKTFAVSSSFAPGGKEDAAAVTSCTQAFAKGTRITLAYPTNAWKEYFLEASPGRARIISPDPWK